MRLKFPELLVSTRLSCCLQLPCVLTTRINASLHGRLQHGSGPQCSFSFYKDCFWLSTFFLITSLFGKESWGMSPQWTQLPTLPCSLGTCLSLLLFPQWPKQCPEGDLPAFSDNPLKACLSLPAFVVISSGNLPRSNLKPTAACEPVGLFLQLNWSMGMVGQGLDTDIAEGGSCRSLRMWLWKRSSQKGGIGWCESKFTSQLMTVGLDGVLIVHACVNASLSCVFCW